MAIVVPDNLPSRANRGEARVFRFLRDALPDDYIVYYEPAVRNRRRGVRKPDFVVIAPELGVLVLEVKSWQLGNLVIADAKFVTIDYRDGAPPQRSTHPLEQASNYMHDLMTQFRYRPELVRQNGPHVGKLLFPMGYGVILTGIPSQQALTTRFGAGAQEIFLAENVLFSEDLKTLEQAPDRAVVKRVREMFGVVFKDFEALTEDQISTIRATLRPEITVSAIGTAAPAGPISSPGRDRLQVLDLKQEQLASSIRSGHRVLLGVAGSGKTVILLAHARKLAASDPPKRILLLCFNIALAASLRSRLADDPNRDCIEVRHFHDWERVPEVERTRVYDAILIDEANDFEPEWFSTVVAGLADPEDGDLLVVGDGAQVIYRRGQFTWKSVGIKAVGRTLGKRFNLTQNYRNTRPILELAHSLIETRADQPDDDIAFAPIAPESALRGGPEPKIIACRSRYEEANRVAEWIDGLLQGRGSERPLEEREIAVLFPCKEKPNGDRFFEALREEIGRIGKHRPCLLDSRGDKLSYSDQKPGIRISNIQNAKGLEFHAVACVWADQLPRPWVPDPDGNAERRLLYVAMTRACDHLLLTWSPRKGDCLVKDLQRVALGVPEGSRRRAQT